MKQCLVGTYNHAEILAVMSTDAWTNDDELKQIKLIKWMIIHF